MNLKFHLLFRIVLIAVACLIATAAYVLYQTDRQARQQAVISADSLSRQLIMQLWRIDAGSGEIQRFPDFDLWKQTGSVPGLCVRFLSVNNEPVRSLCNGSSVSAPTWPDAFASAYRLVFNPGLDVWRQIVFNGRRYGALVIAPSAEMEMADAWNNIQNLIGFSAVTVPAICVLVYLSISRILRPARLIVDGLARMATGDLSVRLPNFEVAEWQLTATAINRLAVAQEQLLAERGKLAVRLMTVQEEERRYLARELHDEFGQCLAAISAVAASITQSAEQDCPALVPEARQITRITGHIMAGVRGLLLRLRPFESGEPGLAANLNSLTANWNVHCGGKTRYRLIIDGACEQLPEPLPVTVFRIVQECLTNAAKHANAANVTVTLTRSADSLMLIIEDDGVASQLPFAKNCGIGLPGIRERIMALAGRMNLTIAEPHGLIIQIQLPIRPAEVLQ
ncbi:MAG: sensor histidine kinase [Methylovulum sp.]|nr:MAG: sensor histidine kinase [Methylovulum sp.]